MWKVWVWKTGYVAWNLHLTARSALHVLRLSLFAYTFVRIGWLNYKKLKSRMTCSYCCCCCCCSLVVSSHGQNNLLGGPGENICPLFPYWHFKYIQIQLTYNSVETLQALGPWPLTWNSNFHLTFLFLSKKQREKVIVLQKLINFEIDPSVMGVGIRCIQFNVLNNLCLHISLKIHLIKHIRLSAMGLGLITNDNETIDLSLLLSWYF